MTTKDAQPLGAESDDRTAESDARAAMEAADLTRLPMHIQAALTAPVPTLEIAAELRRLLPEPRHYGTEKSGAGRQLRSRRRMTPEEREARKQERKAQRKREEQEAINAYVAEVLKNCPPLTSSRLDELAQMLYPAGCSWSDMRRADPDRC